MKKIDDVFFEDIPNQNSRYNENQLSLHLENHKHFTLRNYLQGIAEEYNRYHKTEIEKNFNLFGRSRMEDVRYDEIDTLYGQTIGERQPILTNFYIILVKIKLLIK